MISREQLPEQTVCERRRRFQINPGPLKRVARKALATDYELSQAVRCRAQTRRGTRCIRDAERDSDYCWQHRESRS